MTTAKITDANVTTAKIADNAVTRAKLESLGQQVSSASGSFTTTSATYTDVTNLSVSITTSGRPVMLMLQSDGSNEGYIGGQISSSDIVDVSIAFDRGGTTIAEMTCEAKAGTGASDRYKIAPSSFMYIDTPTADTYTYKVQCKRNNSNFTAEVDNVVLVAYEL